MKLNLRLAGLTETSLYDCNPEGSMFPTKTVGVTQLPGRLILAVKDGFCRFNFTDYHHIHVDNALDPVVMDRSKEIHKGRFDLSTLPRPVKFYRNVDNSGISWRCFCARGPLKWRLEKQEFVEFRMSIPDESESLFIWARWPHRSYPRGPLEMQSQSTILELDEKSLTKFTDFWEALNDKKS